MFCFSFLFYTLLCYYSLQFCGYILLTPPPCCVQIRPSLSFVLLWDQRKAHTKVWHMSLKTLVSFASTKWALNYRPRSKYVLSSFRLEMQNDICHSSLTYVVLHFGSKVFCFAFLNFVINLLEIFLKLNYPYLGRSTKWWGCHRHAP